MNQQGHWELDFMSKAPLESLQGQIPQFHTVWFIQNDTVARWKGFIMIGTCRQDFIQIERIPWNNAVHQSYSGCSRACRINNWMKTLRTVQFIFSDIQLNIMVKINSEYAMIPSYSMNHTEWPLNGHILFWIRVWNGTNGHFRTERKVLRPIGVLQYLASRQILTRN